MSHTVECDCPDCEREENVRFAAGVMVAVLCTLVLGGLVVACLWIAGVI